MRTSVLLLALAVWTLLPAAEPRGALEQWNIELSAAAKRKPTPPVDQVTPHRPRHRAGPPDPSLGPDGRPYRVPEYLRDQCYIDEGYGRFSSCNNRN